MNDSDIKAPLRLQSTVVCCSVLLSFQCISSISNCMRYQNYWNMNSNSSTFNKCLSCKMKSTNSCTKQKYHRLLCPLQMNGSGEKSNGGTAENFPSQGFHASLTFNYFISSTAVFRIFTRWFYALELEGDYFYF